MPLTQADRQQIDGYIRPKSGDPRPNLARVMLETHLKQDPFDEEARKALAKINKLFPVTTTPPPISLPVAKPSPVSKTTSVAVARPAAFLPDTPVSAPAADSEIETIKAAIRERRYEEAESLLILSDHPEADKLRERLAAMRPVGVSREKAKREDELPDMTGKLSITVFLLIFLTLFGLVALAVWLPEAKRYPDAPGAGGLILANRVVTYILRGILAALLFMLALLFFSYLTRPAAY